MFHRILLMKFNCFVEFVMFNQVLHRAVVDVNEEGTEAAAATAVVYLLGCARFPREILEFRADRPFLFFIRDNATKSILFIGRLVRPDPLSG